MSLYFSNDNYRNIANSKGECFNYSLSSFRAFGILLKDLEFGDVDVLLESFSNLYDVSSDKLYVYLQSDRVSDEFLERLLGLALELVSEGKNMGSKVTVRSNGRKSSSSSWISHCLNVGVVCKNLANASELDSDKAFALGILHDIGRKKSQEFDHTINGFEYLVNLGNVDEAFSCLTHSFVNGGRCANNEKAEPGFYLDEEGNPHFDENNEKDDVTVFLENYKFNDYDLILNIADLVATSKGAATIEERLKDIATRREIDPINRGYFLCELINLVNYFLMKFGYNETISIEKFYKGRELAEVESIVSDKSNQFNVLYTDIVKKNEFFY